MSRPVLRDGRGFAGHLILGSLKRHYLEEASVGWAFSQGVSKIVWAPQVTPKSSSQVSANIYWEREYDRYNKCLY